MIDDQTKLIILLGLVVFIAFANMGTGLDIKDSLLSVVSPDSSMSNYIDYMIENNKKLSLENGIATLAFIAHLGLYLIIFLYIIEKQGFLSGIIITLVLLTVLNIVYFSFILEQSFKFDMILDMIGGSGLFKVLISFGTLTGNGGSVMSQPSLFNDTINNTITNTNISMDLS